MIKRIKEILVTLLFVQAALAAQDLTGIAGAFADIGIGARASATGLAWTGYAEGAEGVVWNPAGLAGVKKADAIFSYTNQLDIIDYHFLAAGVPLNNKQALGFALLSSGDDALREWTFSGTWSFRISKLSIGAGLKFRYASFGNNPLNRDDLAIFDDEEINAGIMNRVYGNASGFGLDLGILYRPNGNLGVGLTLKDIYSPVYWDSRNDNPVNKPEGKYSELVPFEMVLGLSYMMKENLRFNADYSPALLDETDNRVGGGLEAKLLDLLYIRGGAMFYLRDDYNTKYMAGLGFDVDLGSFSVRPDFTYMFEYLDNSLRFSLGVEF